MPDTLTANYVTDDITTAFPLVLNDRWRVVDDPLQWILQYRRFKYGHSGGSENPKAWEGRRFCRSSAALKRDIGELCGEVDQVALAIIDTWP